MSTSAKAELNFKSLTKTRSLFLPEGLNTLIPLNDGSILAETAVVKRSPIDASLGDLSSEETAKELPQFNLNLHFRIEDLPSIAHLYVEDIILNPNTLSEIRRIRGTIGRRSLDNGKIVSYAIDKTIYEFDPTNGRRTRIHDYQSNYGRNDKFPKLPKPNYFFSIDRMLYAIAGAETSQESNTEFLQPNSLYKFDQQFRVWKFITRLAFQPRLAASHLHSIVLLGDSDVAVFNTTTGIFNESKLDFSNYEPTSIAKIGANWAISVSKSGGKSNSLVTDSEIWVFSDSFDSILLRKTLIGFGATKLSSSAMPIPVVWP